MPIAHGSISHEARGQERIVFVPQQPVLFAALTVAENIEVFRQSAGFADGDLAAIDQLLESYGLTQLATKLGGEISGGEQQRTALARAVAVAPSLLLVDEPTARQDADHRDLVTSSLVDAAREGVLVVATHEPEVAAVCDRVVTIDPD
jgi:putative ABC transport system ATP-binding protein